MTTYVSDYKSRLIKLQILPLMYILDLNDIIFFVRSLKTPRKGFNIKNFISFTLGDTRSANSHKLQHTRSTNNSSNNFYFNRLPRIWNALLVININLDTKIIKQQLLSYFWHHFEHNFRSDDACSYSFLCGCSRCNQHPATTNFYNLN